MIAREEEDIPLSTLEWTPAVWDPPSAGLCGYGITMNAIQVVPEMRDIHALGSSIMAETFFNARHGPDDIPEQNLPSGADL
jgi:hypothetical protein